MPGCKEPVGAGAVAQCPGARRGGAWLGQSVGMGHARAAYPLHPLLELLLELTRPPCFHPAEKRGQD